MMRGHTLHRHKQCRTCTRDAHYLLNKRAQCTENGTSVRSQQEMKKKERDDDQAEKLADL